MLTVQDEILESEARFEIRDEQDNVLHSGVTIEMITNVIQKGTPLNKAFFDSIKADIDDITTKISTGSLSLSNSLQTINVGFEPDLVICYSEKHNSATIGTSANTPKEYYIARILTKAFYSEDGCITSSGFTHKSTIISGSPDINYYIAIKF